MKRSLVLAAVVVLANLLGACAGPPPRPAADRSAGTHSQQPTPDGYYRVRRGDNLNAIAFKFGLDWREIARLNGISSPYIIYPDQLLRLTASVQPRSASAAPSSGSPATRVSPASSPTGATTRALDTPAASTTTAGVAVDRSAAPAPPTAPPSRSGQAEVQGTQAPAGSSYSAPAADPARWLWPTEGRLVSTFRADDPARKGIDIGGQPGQQIIASAAGQVVYSGSGMIGYGELIIIKHNDRLLSAYAHNSKRLVAEGQQVAAGSPIAAMGTNDRSQALLHFEIRLNGKPEDPLRYLPKR
jgi:lipoprotein NlpD